MSAINSVANRTSKNIYLDSKIRILSEPEDNI